ncbi:hypothetical protein COOONC_04736 [Cooperia oncophora]
MQVCERTCSSFAVAHTETSSTSIKQRLLCNRAGVHTPKATKRKKNKTRKDVQYCSCHLTTVFSKDGTVITRGCLGHVGHELDPALLRFSDEQRMYLKNLLEEHPMDYIITCLRESDPTMSTRLSYVAKVDLHNIARKYNVVPKLKYGDDATSSRSCSEEKNPDYGVIENDDKEYGSVLPEDMAGKDDGMIIVDDDGDLSPLEADVKESIKIEQIRREAGARKLDAIKTTWAAVEASATFLAKLGTKSSIGKLEEILGHLQTAARIATFS